MTRIFQPADESEDQVLVQIAERESVLGDAFDVVGVFQQHAECHFVGRNRVCTEVSRPGQEFMEELMRNICEIIACHVETPLERSCRILS